MLLEPLAEALAHADALVGCVADGRVHLAPRFFRGAEAPVRQHGLHVLAGLAGQSDFKVVDRGRAVHGEGGGVAAVQQVDQNRRETAFDDVAADTPEDAAALDAGLAERGDDGPQGIRGEQLGQTVQPAREGQRFLWRQTHVLHPHLAAAGFEGHGRKGREIERMLLVAAHGRAPFLPRRRTFSRARAVWLRRFLTTCSGVPAATT